MSEEKQREENTESIPSLKLEGKQAAVMAEILTQYVAPQSQSEDNQWANTLLEISQWTDSTVCSFQLYGENRLVQTDVDSGRPASIITISNLALDRFCAAWIQWRVNHYTLPAKEDEKDDGSLGDLGDHPF